MRIFLKIHRDVQGKINEQLYCNSLLKLFSFSFARLLYSYRNYRLVTIDLLLISCFIELHVYTYSLFMMVKDQSTITIQHYLSLWKNYL